MTEVPVGISGRQVPRLGEALSGQQLCNCERGTRVAPSNCERGTRVAPEYRTRAPEYHFVSHPGVGWEDGDDQRVVGRLHHGSVEDNGKPFGIDPHGVAVSLHYRLA